MNERVTLPRRSGNGVKSAAVHSIALAQSVRCQTLGEVSEHGGPATRLQVENETVAKGLTLERVERRIKDERMVSLLRNDGRIIDRWLDWRLWKSRRLTD